jgi:hypothetical protein
MQALDERREVNEAASHELDLERWFAASEPLAIDDDPDWTDLPRIRGPMPARVNLRPRERRASRRW